MYNKIGVFFFSVLFLFCAVGTAYSAPNTRGVRITVRDEGAAKTLALYDKITAVIIGIDRYQNLKAEHQLKFAVRDAKGVEQVLRERYPVSKIITLYNEEATRDNIMKVLQGDLATAGSDEAIFIYFAGHGITRSPQQQKKLGYLIPNDGSLEINEMHKNISMQQISSDISPLIPAKHILFVMDACFGGLLLSTRGAGLEPSHKLAYLEEITREPVRQIITAGGENEEVLDGGLYGHSVFTGRLIEALKNNKDFITAQELGLELEKKVYGDAMSKGHKQRPQVGKIYGTGDFVFIPDFEKLKKESEGEVSTLEAEMRELERLKQEAGKRKEDAKIRELERERLLKESALKQARLREESAQREAEMRKRMEEESLKDAEKIKIQEKERGERLAYLKLQSEKMKQELGGIASALGITEAQTEVKRLNTMIAKLGSDYQTEMPKQLKPVKDYYEPKIKKAENQPPMDKMFETELEYKERLEKAKIEVSSLKTELSQKETAITGQLKAGMSGQIKPLLEQRDNLTKQEFPVGNKEIKWKFVKYTPEKEEFTISGLIKDIVVGINISIPKAKAREYYQNPDLLVASAAINIASDGSREPLKFTLQGPEGDNYNTSRITREFADPTTGMEFVFVKGGCFQMGDTFGDGDNSEKPVHEVCVDALYMGKYEVTQKEWVAIMGSNPSYFRECGDNCPVEKVSWDDAQEYINKLNQKFPSNSPFSKGGQGGFRLPTEAEWEYAARSGGKNEKYAGSNDIDSVAWYESNSGNKTHPVGQKKPNGLGLYDMSGNVWEWVNDWYDSGYYENSPKDNSKGPSSGQYRVLRGGSWKVWPQYLRASIRLWYEPSTRYGSYGFRLSVSAQ
ncbi:MAG: SUMF1/EgtB/PvdO family nonheme iron enzyme [Deltaproteobacteria bacterium]|nr:SUMF1/EgtB/PvdO family nonheme iron enzyme [Deltaproteobacteria bacterium]